MAQRRRSSRAPFLRFAIAVTGGNRAIDLHVNGIEIIRTITSTYQSSMLVYHAQKLCYATMPCLEHFHHIPLLYLHQVVPYRLCRSLLNEACTSAVSPSCIVRISTSLEHEDMIISSLCPCPFLSTQIHWQTIR